MEFYMYSPERAMEIADFLESRETEQMVLSEGLTSKQICSRDKHTVFYCVDGGQLAAVGKIFSYNMDDENRIAWKRLLDDDPQGVIHKIETLGADIQVVAALYVRKGSEQQRESLWDCLLRPMADRHIVFLFDQRFRKQVPPGFSVLPVQGTMLFCHRAPKIQYEYQYFDETVCLALPKRQVPETVEMEKAHFRGMKRLLGYQICDTEGESWFFRSYGAQCEAAIYEIDQQDLLRYQRWINLCDFEESLCCIEGMDILVYSLKENRAKEKRGELLWNDCLREMVQNRTSEWNCIADAFFLFPVTYESKSRILAAVPRQDEDMEALFHFINIRMQCETGVPYGKEGIDLMERFKNRIARFYLGKIKVQITLEMLLDVYDHEDIPVGQSASVDVFLTIDTESKVGALTLVSLSAPFLLSHLMDNIMRNQLVVVSGTHENLYAYMYSHWGLKLSGTPKHMITILREKSCLNNNQIASLLMAETIYAENEDFGIFSDRDVLKEVESEQGRGQYNRAFVCASSNVVLQFCQDMFGSKRMRLYEESFTYYYIELVVMEEAAIKMHDADIIGLMSVASKLNATDFLRSAGDITNQFLRTAVFWNVQVNYPSSQRSLAMIRDAFKIDQARTQMVEDQKQLDNIFSINQEYIDRINNDEEKTRDNQTNFALSILSVFCVVSALIDGHDYLESLSWLIPDNVLFWVANVVFPLSILFVFAFALYKLF
ncbi:MAG: hypothetical protein LUG65_05910, partial [Clostridiales bacterium]|nr:hypothetical protein [Clostridiales bacterium]